MCISNYVSNVSLKEVAKRAAWLGNDETHYERKWGEKDCSDLKKTIAMTISWIELEQHTRDLQIDMPAGR